MVFVVFWLVAFGFIFRISAVLFIFSSVFVICKLEVLSASTESGANILKHVNQQCFQAAVNLQGWYAKDRLCSVDH